jgi:hypothetical protein
MSGPDAREHRAEPLHMMPVGAVPQRDGATVDLDAHVPAGSLGHGNSAARVSVSGRRQQHGQVALVRHRYHADHDAQRSWLQAVGARWSVHAILTKYGQPTHNALPVRARSDRSTIRQKRARCAVVPHVALAQVVITRGGITNAPMAISRLRV